MHPLDCLLFVSPHSHSIITVRFDANLNRSFSLPRMQIKQLHRNTERYSLDSYLFWVHDLLHIACCWNESAKCRFVSFFYFSLFPRMCHLPWHLNVKFHQMHFMSLCFCDCACMRVCARRHSIVIRLVKMQTSARSTHIYVYEKAASHSVNTVRL